MRYLIPISILMITWNSNLWDGDTFWRQTNICSYKEHNLYGRVQIVDSFPDLKVQLVTSFPDLKVKVVDYQPTRCGEWQMVSEFPDLKVQFVTSFPDLKIQYVQSFPGLRDLSKGE